MKRIALVILVGCGGAKPAPTPVENTAPATEAAAPAGNGSIRVVQRGTTGGVIELAGSRSAAMAAAETEMASVCGANAYTIVQEGEEAVMSEGADPQMVGVAWRVHYQCNH